MLHTPELLVYLHSQYNQMAKNRKAAMELTMSTMVTIVLVVAALILGIVLVQKIFTGATDSVDVINEKVMGEINNLFADESSSVIVKLGSDRKAKIRVGTEDFGVAIGASTYDGGPSSRTRLQYMLTLDEGSSENCVQKLGKSGAANLISQSTDQWITFDEFDGSSSYAIISLKIPKGTPICSQKILIDVKDTEQAGAETMAGSFFRIELLKKLI